jgi:hypothetical protein
MTPHHLLLRYSLYIISAECCRQEAADPSRGAEMLPADQSKLRGLRGLTTANALIIGALSGQVA